MISPTTLYGVVAQLVERCPEEAGVGGSSPSDSTTSGCRIVVDCVCLPSRNHRGFESHYPLFFIALWSNGRTTDFGSVCAGSNPAGASMSERCSKSSNQDLKNDSAECLRREWDIMG